MKIEPEGFRNFDLLSHEKCRAWLQSIADLLLDSKVEEEIGLYEFYDRPDGFPRSNTFEINAICRRYFKRE